MNVLLRALIEEGDRASLSSLVEWCEDNHDINSPHLYGLIHSVHCSLWHDVLKPCRNLEGSVISMSCLTFYCCVWFTPLYTSLAPLSSFPRIQLHKAWTHPKFDVPILSMSQRILVDTLLGLHWHVLSDMYFTQRDEAWVRDVSTLLELLRSRAAQFIRESCWDMEILDGEPEYAVINTATTSASVFNGYDSDQEVYLSKKKKFDETVDFSQFEAATAEVTLTFIFFCDTLFTSLDIALYHYHKTGELQTPPAIKLTTVQEWLFREMRTLNEQRVVTHRATWYNHLVIHESYVRMFRNTRGLYIQADPRHVLVSINVELIEPPITDFEEIEAQPVQQVDQRTRIMRDAVFDFYSQQHAAIVATLHWTSPDRPKHGIYIYRDEVRNVWIFQLDGGSPSRQDSQHRVPR